MLGKLYISSVLLQTCVDEKAVDLNNTVYCRLWLFKIGVVYLSPKPHQIRMAMQHPKHSKIASVGAIKGTRSNTDFVSACLLFVTCSWRCELGVWCKRPMGK